MTLEALEKSIRKAGFIPRFPIEVDQNLRIYYGFKRLDACMNVGLETIPCHIAETDETKNIPIIYFRILDHLRIWINPLTFTKLMKSLNVNSDFKRVSKKELLKILKEMKGMKLVRHCGNGNGWTDVRGRAGRYSNNDV